MKAIGIALGLLLLFCNLSCAKNTASKKKTFSEEKFLDVVSHLKLPKGWKVPKIYPNSPCRKEGESLYAVEADFDGDRKKDVAMILANKSEKGLGLWIATHKAVGWQKVASTNHRDGSGDLGVSLVEPGKYKTACAKGYGSPCGKNELKELDLKRAGVMFFTCESAASIIWWDKKKFERTWISD